MTTPHRRARLERCAAQRIEGIRFAFERTADLHNTSAAIRSLEALGLPHIDIVEPTGRGARVDEKVAIGASKWIHLSRYDTTDDWLRHVRTTTTRLWVSYLPDGASAGRDLRDWTPDEGPTTFVFGNEYAGVSATMLAAADCTFTIPMYGMVQSYNLSVSASLVAWHVRQQIESLGDSGPWHLHPNAQTSLLRTWTYDQDYHP